MTVFYKLIMASVIILMLPEQNFGQAPSIPNASAFTVFTGSGALNNAGVTNVEGDIGTNTGTIGGVPILFTGQSHIGDQEAIDAQADLTAVFASFSSSGGACNTLSTPFGNGTTLTAGTYCLGSAGVITGDLTLNGGNNPNAVFVFKIGGELTGTNANIILTGLTSWENVYFIVDGAFNLNQTNTSIFRGNVITQGVISLSTGDPLQGRLLSATGAINLENNTISDFENPLPVTLTNFTVRKAEMQTAMLEWATTAETNSDRFEIQRSKNGKIWDQLAVVNAKGESSNLVKYQYKDTKPEAGTNLYRLKMVDRDASFAYSRIQSAEFNVALTTVLYPNPAVDYLTLHVDDISLVQRIQISNILGNSVYDKIKNATDLSSRVDVQNLPAGMYIVRITRATGAIASAKIIKQ